MSSNIITTTIDENYPVAGRDNDTQGFRDNFNIIKSNFAFAKSEIEDLQDKVILKAPLSNNTETNNNMGGVDIVDVNLLKSTTTMYSADISLSEATVSFNNGSYHKYNLTNSSSEYILNLLDWPDVESLQRNRCAKITVELLSTDGDKTITWTSSSSVGTNSLIKKTSSWTDTFTIPISASPTDYKGVVFEFWTYDGGATVYANYLGIFE